MTYRFLIFLLLFGFSSYGQIPSDLSRECRAFISSLHSGMEWGFLEVPEDWKNPNGNQISIFYYLRRQDQGSDRKVPYVFFNGGPSSDSHGTYGIFLNSISRQMTAVTFDQRGTGCSTSYPTQRERQSGQDLVDRLANWGSEGIVEDAEALRRHLFGSQKWKAFGQSYGALINFRYLEKYPESLHSVHSHGFSLMSDSLDMMRRRVHGQRQVVEQFFLKYPDAKTKLTEASQMLRETDCVSDEYAKICGATLLDSLSVFVGFRDSWSDLVDMIDYVHELLSEGNRSMALMMVRDTAALFTGGDSGLGSEVISATEIVPGIADDQVCRQLDQEIRDSGQNPDSFLLYECRIYINAVSEDTRSPRYPNRQISFSRVVENIKKFPELPIYLYSGKYDAFSPPTIFEEIVNALNGVSNFFYHSFSSTGHEGFLREKTVWENLLKE